jgi:drug/metabolite transporter (DMT)-like permease
VGTQSAAVTPVGARSAAHALKVGDRRALDARAYALLFGCTLLWGLQQVAVKSILSDISPVMQGALRSLLAAVLLLLWARTRAIPLFQRDGTLVPGVGAGLLFALEFFLIYYGLAHTTASRMIVFVYLSPCLTALGLALWVPGERLSPLQWLGTALAFGGIAVAFAEGFTAANDTWVGYLCGVLAAVAWAATTVLIRATRLAHAAATKTLAYQLVVSALLLPLASLALGEPGIVRLTPLAVASVLYQGAVVAFASYLVWFWLLTRYLAGRLSVFAFLTPLFGVIFGVLLLDEPLSPLFGTAALLVGAGIALVNAPRKPLK